MHASGGLRTTYHYAQLVCENMLKVDNRFIRWSSVGDDGKEIDDENPLLTRARWWNAKEVDNAQARDQ